MSGKREQGGAAALAKVPAVTLGFWAVKVLATTLGETAGDAVTMSWLGETTARANGWGYLVGTALLAAPLVLLVAAQIRTRSFNAWLYWATILASTTAGTALADFFTRTLFTRWLGVDQVLAYLFGSLALLGCVMVTLLVWRRTLGTISVSSVATPRAEAYYWLTITFSQTLGTALGDWTVDSFGEATFMGLESGYVLGALVYVVLLAGVALLYRFTALSRSALFWAAFILTRPLGATVGDFLDKPLAKGGLAFTQKGASGVLLVAILVLLALLPQRAARADAAH